MRLPMDLPGSFQEISQKPLSDAIHFDILSLFVAR
jgi:hypothetical protein